MVSKLGKISPILPRSLTFSILQQGDNFFPLNIQLELLVYSLEADYYNRLTFYEQAQIPILLTVQKICIIVPIYETARIFIWNTMSEKYLVAWHHALWISVNINSQNKKKKRKKNPKPFSSVWNIDLRFGVILYPVREFNSSSKLIIVMSHFLEKPEVELNLKTQFSSNWFQSILEKRCNTMESNSLFKILLASFSYFFDRFYYFSLNPLWPMYIFHQYRKKKLCLSQFLQEMITGYAANLPDYGSEEYSFWKAVETLLAICIGAV